MADPKPISLTQVTPEQYDGAVAPQPFVVVGSIPGGTGTISETGWAAYSDTQYTQASPLSLTGETDTLLPNNAASIIETYKPESITEFYDGSSILGTTGMAIGMTVDFTVVPTSSGATYIDSWINIGGTVGQLYRRTSSFPKGAGFPRQVAYTTDMYTLDTWAANGGRVYVRSNGPCQIYNVRYIFFLRYKP